MAVRVGARVIRVTLVLLVVLVEAVEAAEAAAAGVISVLYLLSQVRAQLALRVMPLGARVEMVGAVEPEVTLRG